MKNLHNISNVFVSSVSWSSGSRKIHTRIDSFNKSTLINKCILYKSLLGKTLIILTVLFFGAFVPYAQTVYNYTGGVQTYTVPVGVFSLCVEVRGAQGNANAQSLSLGGLGGEVTGNLAVVPGQVLQIYVGGGGITSTAGGYNGGANGGTQPGCVIAIGGGGGGASDIRVASYGLANRVAVGGGGGGTGGNRSVGCSPGTGGGGGGGYYGGGGGGAYGGSPGFGGTQVGGGAGGASCCGCPLSPQPGAAGGLGVGGNGGGLTGTNNQAANNPGCAGGAGGAAIGGQGPNCTGGTGCPSTWAGASGGGGSNYNGGLTGATSVQGVKAGNGEVVICMPLPINLLNFSAVFQKSSRHVDLKWATASEQNNELFTIEKSLDAINWVTVGSVKGAGESNEVTEYESADLEPFEGLSYYRLKQTDHDGQSTYSNIININVRPDYSVNIFPNPTEGDIVLNYSTISTGQLEVKIIDISGSIVAEYTFDNVQKGDNNFEIATSSLENGMYFLFVNDFQNTYNLKFLKK